MSSHTLDWNKIDEEELKDFLYMNEIEFSEDITVEELYNKVDSIYRDSLENESNLELTPNIKELIIKSPTFTNLDDYMLSVIMSNMSYEDIKSLCMTKVIPECDSIYFWKSYLMERYDFLSQGSVETLKIIAEFFAEIDKLDQDIIDRY